ncbi:MAG: DUF2510 domain-containing protein [Propionibacteriaceae bacterium]|jgi:hypothetical protein|nr:DUF2510 domain-containing protein [Propionibacteriaceae bacterium]
MALKGWYPDPGGQTGRYRYWDGSGWSAATTTNPNSAPPPSTKAADNDQQRSRDRGWLYALIALLVITLGVVVFIMLRGGVSDRPPAVEDSNSAKPTVSGWDETSVPSTPPPDPTDGGGEYISCPQTSMAADTRQPTGRVASGMLSFQASGGHWSTSTAYFAMAYDVHEQTQTIPNESGFYSAASVGRLAIADGYTDIAVAAQQVMMCHSTYRHYVDRPTDVLVAGEAIRVSGHHAWHIQWQNNYDPELRGFDGEILDVIVVDLGPDVDYLGLFFSCRPIGYEDFRLDIEAVIASLRVDE